MLAQGQHVLGTVSMQLPSREASVWRVQSTQNAVRVPLLPLPLPPHDECRYM